MIMRGDRISLGQFTQEHSMRYLEWVNDSTIATSLTRTLPVTEREHLKWYESSVGRADAVFFSVSHNESEEYLGNVWLWGLHTIHRSAELRILLSPESAGKGFGTEACKLMLEFAFARLNLNKVFLYVWEKNTSARRTFEKAGFKEEARLTQEYYLEGRYHDGLRMALLRQDWPTRRE